MPADLALDSLRKMLAKGNTQLIEVLPEKEYVEEHLPGAINIPLKSMNRDSVAALDRSRPTVVYCWDDI
nr:rhodanese-like domain-containing protein [Actinomycetota bacterium]